MLVSLVRDPESAIGLHRHGQVLLEGISRSEARLQTLEHTSSVAPKLSFPSLNRL